MRFVIGPDEMPLPQGLRRLFGLMRPLRGARPAAACPGEGGAGRSAAMRQMSFDLPGAIANGELLSYYQPILDLGSGELDGFESLARWNHPQFGMVSPTVFIPMAEELNAINALCFTLLEQACADVREWPAALRLSINLSPVQLCDADLPARLFGILAAGGLDPQRLTVELTEGEPVSDLPTARRTVDALREGGVMLALDDFGAGHTSLRYLNDLPFDRLKIDRSFVATINGRTGRMIVRSIIALAHSLGIKVTAEGIENGEHIAILRLLGCDQGQGFLFGRPMAAADALRMIEARSSPAFPLPQVAPDVPDHVAPPARRAMNGGDVV